MQFPAAPAVGSAPIDLLAVAHAPAMQINRRVYRALVRRGWRVELAMPDRLPWNPDPAAVQPDDPEDPPIHRLTPRGGYTRTWSFDGLVELLEARRPRLVYLENEPDSSMALVLGKWCARNGGRLVVNTNENDIPPILSALVRRGLKPALRSLRTRLWTLLTRRYIAHVVAFSKGSAEAMRAIGFGDKVTVTPLGFERSLFHPDDERRAAVRARLGLVDPVVAYFGRLVPNKGIHLLIAALDRVKALRWQFLIDDFFQHSDEYAERLRKAIAEAGIAERTISFTASHDEMPEYMRAADIVAVPSTWREQYGRVAPEAMACGCAVVVSDIGALPELVGSAGLLVPSGDVDALAGALAELIEDHDQRRRLGAAAVERAHALLSIDRQVELLDRLFRELTGDGPR